MATAVDRDAIEATIRDRWDTLTIGVRRYDATDTNTPTMRRWMRATRRFAGRLVHGIQEGQEYDALTTLEDRLVRILKDELIAFAVEIETGRAGGRP